MYHHISTVFLMCVSERWGPVLCQTDSLTGV